MVISVFRSHTASPVMRTGCRATAGEGIADSRRRSLTSAVDHEDLGGDPGPCAEEARAQHWELAHVQIRIRELVVLRILVEGRRSRPTRRTPRRRPAAEMRASLKCWPHVSEQ